MCTRNLPGSRMYSYSVLKQEKLTVEWLDAFTECSQNVRERLLLVACFLGLSSIKLYCFSVANCFKKSHCVCLSSVFSGCTEHVVLGTVPGRTEGYSSTR